MVRKIVTDLATLQQVCQEVPEHLIQQITKDLLDTATATKNCAGLAAIQMGDPYRAFAMKKPDGFVVVINPSIIDKKGHVPGKEGCLSRPGVSVTILRAQKIRVLLDGKEVIFEGQLARIFQHEYDHLDGKVIGVKKQAIAA